MENRQFHEPGVRTKLFIGQETVGIGKIDLLEAVEKTGSISAAAAYMGMNYRRAWFLLNSMQNVFEAPLFITKRGGSGQGGAKLTNDGRDLIRYYRQAVQYVDQEFMPMLDWIKSRQKTSITSDSNLSETNSGEPHSNGDAKDSIK